ncbi:hypothetical protein [Micromonospora sp. Llam0]|uniref:hypothetical protein n=1 Tax=Micromonospora sp. Llam0 TaxID=2485143 RepID=UPI0011CE16CD|nr:hypothetical protein [Micromonospora sp. Llam0]
MAQRRAPARHRAAAVRQAVANVAVQDAAEAGRGGVAGATAVHRDALAVSAVHRDALAVSAGAGGAVVLAAGRRQTP